MSELSTTLATFRVRVSEWESFKQWAAGRGNSASSELQRFVSRAVSGDYLDSSHELPDGLATMDEVDSVVTALEMRLTRQIESLRASWQKLELQVVPTSPPVAVESKGISTAELVALLAQSEEPRAKRTLQEYANKNKYPEGFGWRAHKSGNSWLWFEVPCNSRSGL